MDARRQAYVDAQRRAEKWKGIAEKKCRCPSKEEMHNREWLAGLAMNVLQNPNADREGISSAKKTIYDLIMKRGEMIMPKWKLAED